MLAASVLSEWFQHQPGRRSPLEDLAGSRAERSGLEGKDLSLFWETVFGTVRWKRLLEWHLKKYLRRMGDLPLPVRMIFMSGCYQVLFLSRIPFFAAVDEAVKAVKKMGFPWAGGLVNAVLRKTNSSAKVIPKDEDFFKRRCSNNFLNCLSVFSSHPHWMVRRWERQLGTEKAVLICLQNNLRPPLTIRVNTLKTTRDELRSLFSGEKIDSIPGRISPEALLLPQFRGRVQGLPGFQNGLFQVQDEASQLASLMLNPAPGQNVLDLCAGVGGKSTHIATLMNNQGKVICVDTSSRRLEKLGENAQRLGITITKAQTPDIDIQGMRFNRILVDAPCSGTGVIRRHPDIKWNRTPDMLSKFTAIQRQLLEKAARLLGPGGGLVYSVCSLEHEEGPGLIEDFIRHNEAFRILNASKLLPSEARELITREGFLKILPGQYKMDGFFAAALTRKGHPCI